MTYHAPPVFETFGPAGEILSMKKGGAKGYTDAVAAAIHTRFSAKTRWRSC